MISVKKDYQNPPEALKRDNLRWKAKVESCIEIIGKGEKYEFNESLYGKAREKLIAQYHGKCAYCESNPIATSSPRVDHYRPKKIYYWLAYEWSNLVPACEKCNGAKSDKFPIEGTAFQNPVFDVNYAVLDILEKYYSDEKALLLNPEIDEVEKHISFDESGRPIGLTEKGITTIRELNLERLNLNRFEKLFEFRKYLKALLLVFDNNSNEKQFQKLFNECFEDMRNPSPEKEFIRFRNVIYEKFDEMILLYFERECNEAVASILKYFFENYKKSLQPQ